MTIQADIRPNYAAIKATQSADWASGDYAVIGTTLQIVGEMLAETMDLSPPAYVLDVAAGNGNASLAFARRFHDVVSTDYLPHLLAKGARRAEADGTHVAFQVADAEALPFEDALFDAVVSTFGAMFAPNQMQAAFELMRTCKPGGKIGLANWTAEGFTGQLFETIARYAPLPPGLHTPMRWGDREWIRATFEDAENVEWTTRHFTFRYPSLEHFIDFYRTRCGPIRAAFRGLDRAGRTALETEMAALVDRYNTADDGSLRIAAEYAEVVITK